MNNIEILEGLEKYISFANKQCNFPNDADYKWHKELAGMIENLIQENKELRIQISARETVVDKLIKENKELKQDIEEMYYKGVVLDILQDTLNISRDEAIKILEGY